MISRLLKIASLGLAILAAQERFDLKVRNYFFSGFTGDAASLDKGMKMCEQALAADPDNAEALVWHGAGLNFRAGIAFQKQDTQTGQELWTRSLQEMDHAVQIAPESIGVRIPRGAVLLTASRFVPPDMAKPLLDRAVSDYETAYRLQSASLDQLGTHPKGELLIGLAEGYARTGNPEKAAALYDRLAKDLPGTPYAKKAALYSETRTAQTGCLGCHSAK